MVCNGGCVHADDSYTKSDEAWTALDIVFHVGYLPNIDSMDHPTLGKIVIAGGSGFLGTALAQHFQSLYEVIILGRAKMTSINGIRFVQWDGRTKGEWCRELEGARALINLAGKSVNCRYNNANKRAILDSRIESTKVLGEAVSACANPPKVWIQMSSATIYCHSEDRAMDEDFGEIGDDFSMGVCKAWERTFWDVAPKTVRKIILRTSIVFGPQGGGLLPMTRLVLFGLGGKQGSGKQVVSWIHERDLAGIVEWMINGQAKGVYNVTSPQPVKNAVLMRKLRAALNVPFGLPSPAWLLRIGAAVIRTETELVLKSRWILPKRLIQEGYKFKFPTLDSTLTDILR